MLSPIGSTKGDNVISAILFFLNTALDNILKKFWCAQHVWCTHILTPAFRTISFCYEEFAVIVTQLPKEYKVREKHFAKKCRKQSYSNAIGNQACTTVLLKFRVLCFLLKPLPYLKNHHLLKVEPTQTTAFHGNHACRSFIQVQGGLVWQRWTTNNSKLLVGDD